MTHRCLTLMLCLLLGATARAEEPSVVKKLYLSGLSHYDLGEYKEALNDFKEAFRLKDDPAFLYNIGQCHRLLKHNEEAVRAYRSYLRRVPGAPNRVEVEQKIAVLQDAIEKQDRARMMQPDRVIEPGRPAVKPDEVPAARPEESPGPAGPVVVAPGPAREAQPVYKKWWLWTAVGGVIVAGVAVGVGVGVSQSGPEGTAFPAVSF